MENERLKKTGVPQACADWGALLPDAAEDRLGEAETRALQMHLKSCTACDAELAEARRGAAWLTLLKGHTPEPPRDMVAGILARTSGAPGLAGTVAPDLYPQQPVFLQPEFRLPASDLGPQRTRTGSLQQRFARWLGLGDRPVTLLHPRLTMTAAMAFCSVCLTLNLLGVSVTQMHAEDLRPLTLQHSVEGEGATLLRSLGSTRVVYRMESRVNSWLTASAVQDGEGLRQ